MAISPKLHNSTPEDPRWKLRHETTRFQPQVVSNLLAISPGILKFVIDRPEDITEVIQWLHNIPDLNPSIVWLMPQARTREQLRTKSHWLRELARTHGFNFSSRLHVEMFGDTRAT